MTVETKLPPLTEQEEQLAAHFQKRLQELREQREAPIIAPERSLEQRREALVIANKIRTQRKELKAELKAGNTSVQILLMQPPPYILTMKVYDLLRAQPKVGKVKAQKVMKRAGCSLSKTVDGLSARQRAEVIVQLRFPISTI